MARVAIVNPPKHRKRARRKRVLSAKARRALLKNLRKARRALAPRVRRVARRAVRRAKRRARKVSRKFRNPFQSTLAVLGNPRRSHRKRRHTMARRKHRRHHRRSLSNPFSANALLRTPKEMISTGFIMEAAGVAAGFVLPNMAMNYLPASWRSSLVGYYATKVGTITVLSAAASLVSKRVSKFVLVGGGVSLMLDIYTELTKGVSPAAPAPAATPATNAFYGNLNAYYGGMVNDWEV